LSSKSTTGIWAELESGGPAAAADRRGDCAVGLAAVAAIFEGPAPGEESGGPMAPAGEADLGFAGGLGRWLLWLWLPPWPASEWGSAGASSSSGGGGESSLSGVDGPLARSDLVSAAGVLAAAAAVPASVAAGAAESVGSGEERGDEEEWVSWVWLARSRSAVLWGV
jgi:hypothetical protein